MKNFSLLLLACMIGINLSAHASDVVLATFEEGGSDLITNNTPWYQTEFYDAQPEVMANTQTAGINSSSRCFGMVKKANSDWWGAWTFFDLATPIMITAETKYFKMMIFRSVPSGGTTIGWNTNADQWLNSLIPSNYGVWEDVVLDLSDKVGTTLSRIVLLHSNWDGNKSGQATLLFDNFVLSSDPLPRGVTLMDGTGFGLDFEKDSELTYWVSKVDISDDEKNTYSIVSNPYPDDQLNKTAHAMRFDKGDITWWQGGPHFELNGLIELGRAKGLQYLHAAVAIPATAFDESGMCTIQTCAWDHLGKESEKKHLLFEGQELVWNELVFDLTEELNYVQKIAVRFDIRKNASDEWINSPACTFYLDAIAINDQPDPREVIIGIKSVKMENSYFTINNNGTRAAQVVLSMDATVQIGSLNGTQVRIMQVKTGDILYVNTLAPGAYYIKAGNSESASKAEVLIVP